MITYCLEIEECRDQTLKWKETMKIEEEMKTTDPSFKGFYHELRYFNRFNKCIQKFESIMSQVPLEIRNKIEPDVHM